MLCHSLNFYLYIFITTTSKKLEDDWMSSVGHPGHLSSYYQGAVYLKGELEYTVLLILVYTLINYNPNDTSTPSGPA